MLDLVQISALTEEQARETLERIRWPSGPACPHCGSVENITKFRPQSEREQVPSGGARASFRWDYRKVSDSDRMAVALRQAEGRRLAYKQPVRKDD
jgi:hypothetical protein